MGADYAAYAVVGQRIPKHKLFTKELRKVGKHDFAQDVLFHPKTGKKLWESVEVQVIDTDALGDGVQCVWGTDREYCYVGRVVRTGSSNGGEEDGLVRLEAGEAGKVFVQLREKLGALFDGQQFGLWAVLCCSY